MGDMDPDYGPLSRDSKVDVDIEPTTPARVAAKEDQPLLRLMSLPSDVDAEDLPDKSQSIDWWATPPDAGKGEKYRKCLMAQSEIDEKSGKREVLELAGGYDTVDAQRIEPCQL